MKDRKSIVGVFEALWQFEGIFGYTLRKNMQKWRNRGVS